MNKMDPYLKAPEVYETIEGKQMVEGVATSVQYDIVVAQTAREQIAQAIQAWLQDNFGMSEIGDDFPDDLIREDIYDDGHLDLVYIFQDDVEKEMRKLAFMLDPQSAGRLEQYYDENGDKILEKAT